MTPLRLPIRVRPAGPVGPADAILLETDDAAEVLRLVADLAAEGASPSIHPVSTGFLVVLGNPSARPRPGVIRLRSEGGKLFVPVGAEVWPALLGDEVEGLTRERGLVVLPGGRVLAFQPDQPAAIAGLIAPPAIDRPHWSPLPQPKERADRIVEILLDVPGAAADDLFGPGGEGIGDDRTGADENPDDAGTAADSIRLAVGRGMFWAGKSLGLGGLAGLGARWMNEALNAAPRLSKDVLGKQEASLRNLLRMFREGRTDEALRRALPVGDGAERGPRSAGQGELPRHNLRYSLGSLLGAGGGGEGVSYWFGGFDVQAELTQEYRKAAEEAAARGDYRRAAFIHARLLGDYRAAAAALLRGGLAHDAAVLLLDRVGDPVGAAKAFETAGEFDRALKLYREHGQHEAAAELLRKIGEDEEALDEFRLAAAALLHHRDGYFQAGELIRLRARRPDFALAYYQDGWRTRPSPSALPCAGRAARILAGVGDEAAFRSISLEVAQHLAAHPPDEPGAVQLLNDLANLAESPGLERARDDVRDLALIGLARRLRERVAQDPHPAGTVAALFRASAGWRSDLLRDAEFAAGELIRPAGGPPVMKPASSRVQIGQGLVTAVAFAAEAEELFLGFQNGEVHRFRPADGSSSQVALYTHPVAGLAVDPGGEVVVVLWWRSGKRSVLACYARRPDDTFGMSEGRAEGKVDAVALAQNVARCPEPHVGFWADGHLRFLRGTSLVPIGSLPPLATGEGPPRAIVLRPGGTRCLGLAAEVAGRWHLHGRTADEPLELRLGWLPSNSRGSALAQAPLSCRPSPQDGIEIVGVTEEGAVCRSVIDLLDRPGPVARLAATNVSASDLGYRCATIVRSGHVAAVGARSVHWLRGLSSRFARLGVSEDCVERDSIACFACHRTRTLLVVGREGLLIRVPMPGF